MIDFTEIKNGETWEFFSRDFLNELGLVIETSPDRGADRGKDLLVTERHKGNFRSYDFRWLVSCKHFAASGKSVNENDEPNILERLASFKADGFLGIYSTIPTSNLNFRLSELKANGHIKDYKFLDGKLIENHLITAGFSPLLMRYLPKSYRDIRPLHNVFHNYEPLLCDVCEKDLLIDLFTNPEDSIMVFAREYNHEKGTELIHNIYCVCKGKCDSKVQKRCHSQGLLDSWRDISDIVTPIGYLHFVIVILNRIRQGTDRYTDEAFRKQIDIIMKLGQKVLRHTTEGERQCLASTLEFLF